ncbi:MAG: hypothetical protein ACRC1K_11485 [Planctomycetia bacterium]
MRGVLLTVWLLVPAAAGAWHYGPGLTHLALDDAGRAATAADQAAAEERWDDAVAGYDEALAALPTDRVKDGRRLRLQKAKAQMMNAGLPEAYADLKNLEDEVAADKTEDEGFVASVRRAMAGARFYQTWLLRLEGEPETVWEPEIEASRQSYRRLVETADAAKDQAAAKTAREDLEAAVRLARMDLSELQAMNLPCQCQGCKSCKGGVGKKQGKKPSQPQKQDVRSAGLGGGRDTGGH